MSKSLSPRSLATDGNQFTQALVMCAGTAGGTHQLRSLADLKLILITVDELLKSAFV
jgi:hypothetical protein